MRPKKFKKIFEIQKIKENFWDPKIKENFWDPKIKENFWDPKNFCDPMKIFVIQENFFKNFQICHKFVDPKIFWVSKILKICWFISEMYIWKVFAYEKYFQIRFFWCICISICICILNLILYIFVYKLYIPKCIKLNS